MNHEKIVIPEWMLKAATVAYNAKICSLGYKYVIDRSVTEATLEAAIRPLMVILHESNAAFHQDILTRERQRYPGSDEDTSVIMRRVDFEYGVSFARHYIRSLFIKLEPSGSTEVERFRAALEKLAKLGNGDQYGNSEGNTIAQQALGIDRRAPVKPETPAEVKDLLMNKYGIIDWNGIECEIAVEAFRRGQKSSQCLCIIGCSANGECPIHGDRRP